MNPPIEILVEQAKNGDKTALESLILRIQDRVYGLAVRMLSNLPDAEDAAQEILVKVITHLGTYRGESAFTTWVYKIAANYLLTTVKRRGERPEITVESCERMVDQGLRADTLGDAPAGPEQSLIVQELMIGCMQAVLRCLDRKHRIAYILGEIIDVTGEEGAYILDISHETYRKRLSRARQSIQQFMSSNCGLVRPANPCRCERQIQAALESRFIKPNKTPLADHPGPHTDMSFLKKGLRRLDELGRVRMLFRSHPDYKTPSVVINEINRILDKTDL